MTPFKPLPRDELARVFRSQRAVVLMENMMVSVGEELPTALDELVRKDTLTTRGDLFVRGALDVTRLGLGATGWVLQSDGTDALWQALTAASITDFTEAAQDAVGAALTDTATINVTYTDGTNSITFDVLPGGVDHNALLNYVSDQHVAHSSVTLTAGAGLTGGGDISASRTIDVGAGTGITVNANDVALANMADSTIKGRAAGAGTGAPTDLTAAQVAAILSISAISSYTPTLTNVTNLDSSAANTTYYIRVRDFVLVFGNLAANATAAAATQLDISLPVASAIQSSIDLGGVGFCGAVAGFGAAIVGDSVNDRASMTWIATDTNNRSIAFIFGYRII